MYFYWKDTKKESDNKGHTHKSGHSGVSDSVKLSFQDQTECQVNFSGLHLSRRFLNVRKFDQFLYGSVSDER